VCVSKKLTTKNITSRIMKNILSNDQKKVGNILSARLVDNNVLSGHQVELLEVFTDGARVRVIRDDSVVFLAWRNFRGEN
jgi:hypothetical protein